MYNARRFFQLRRGLALATALVGAALAESARAQTSASTVIHGVSFEPRAGAWWVSWQQSSDAAQRFGDLAIDVDYKINPTLSPWASLQITALGFNGELEYARADDDERRTLESLSTVLNYAIGDISFQGQYARAAFDGQLYGETEESWGSGTFETVRQSTDLMIYAFRRLAVGVRNLSYELPQDLYLVQRDDPDTVVESDDGEPVLGFEEVAYRGTLLLVGLDNMQVLDGSGWVYRLRGGFGELEAGGDFIETLDKSLKDDTNNRLSVREPGRVQFLDIQAGYRQTLGRFIRLDAGYRFSQYTARFDSEAPYSLVADYTSRLTGPYLNLAARF